MKISYFGTCAYDHQHLYECLETIKNQALNPDEVVIVDSGDRRIEEELRLFFKNTNIKVVYHFEKLPRVKALNKAIKLSSSKYLIRYDTRSRFDVNYSLEAYDLMKKGDKKFVGGVADIIPEDNSFKAEICANIMKRSYVFFYPRHRRKNYNGYGSSVYLGCFESKLIKSNLYREKINLISEDSIIAIDLKKKGYAPFISNQLLVSYVSRSSIKNILKLFDTYGYCRANAFLLTGKLHSQSRYLLVLIFLVVYLILTFKTIYLSLLGLVVILLALNFFGEIIFQGKKSIIYPFFAIVLQLAWGLGLFRGLLSNILKINLESNFLK